MIKINEIYQSIQGESSYTGWPTVFVRTSGCHLRCHYCDSTYAYYDGQKMSAAEVIAAIGKHSAKHVCVTGGEPLLQTDVLPVMKELCDQGYFVSLETSGAVSCAGVDPQVKKIIDIKTPESGAPNTFVNENLSLVTSHDEFKFVICSEKDFLWAKSFVQQQQLAEKCLVYFSPSFKKVSETWLAEQILISKLDIKLQLQIHKYIWPETQRGV